MSRANSAFRVFSGSLIANSLIFDYHEYRKYSFASFSRRKKVRWPKPRTYLANWCHKAGIPPSYRHHYRRHSIGRRDSSECFPTQTGSLAGWLARAGDSPTLMCSCALLCGARLCCPARLKARKPPWVSFSRLKPERWWPAVQKTCAKLATTWSPLNTGSHGSARFRSVCAWSGSCMKSS